MIKTKKQMFTVIGSFVLVMLLVGVTYAFFNYTRTGTANNIRTGRIYFNTSQNGTLNLTNLFPVASNEVGSSNDEITVRIQGDTTYTGGEEFEISLTSVNNSITSGSTEKAIPINYIASYERTPVATGETPNNIGTSSNSYFTERGSTTAVYQLKETGEVNEGEQVLVGYIPKDGAVDGTLTIKAYLDRSNIAISDTYPSGDVTHTETSGETSVEVVDYTDGTTSEWVAGRTVLTTDEWNSLQNTPISFKVRAEANEGTWVKNPNTLVSIMKRSTQLDTEIDFTQPSSYNNNGNGNGIYTLASTASSANPIMYYRGAVDNNNVYFAGFCWQIVRTTETGGVKIIYNGANTGTNEAPKCEATGAATQLSGTYSNLTKSLAYVGYMWGTVYEYESEAPVSGAIFGTSFVYENGVYKLSAGESGSVGIGHADGRHYTCNLTDANGTCENVRYYFCQYSFYITLSGGESIQDALIKMKTTGVKANDTSSEVKQTIDTWYSSNMTNYTNMLEDAIWCNDRSITEFGGWSESGNKNDFVSYGPRRRLESGTPSLICSDPVDRYTVSSANGNGMLDYPVAMLTADEIMLAGGKYISSYTTDNQLFYLNATGQDLWSLSPNSFGYRTDQNAYEFFLNNTGLVDGWVAQSRGIRPAVSLKPGTGVSGGSGLKTDPYVIS